MFQTVRHWWGSGRGKVTARLFVFELLVVVIGVLIAQGLASLVGDRATQRQVSEERMRLDFEIGRTRQASRGWIAAVPCLRERVDALIDATGPSSRTLSESDVAMPGGGYYTVEPLSADIARAFRDRYGADRTDAYFLANSVSHKVGDHIYEARQEWAKFGLLTLGQAKLNESDRAELRGAGIRLRWLLGTIGSQSRSMDDLGQQLNIGPIAGNTLGIPDTPAARCEEIWRNNNIYRVARG